MALIKCPECKKEISDKSKTCIHCGCPVENETKYYCEECGKKILKTDKVCSNCGCPINLEKKQNKSNFLKEKLSKYLNNIKTKNKKTIINCYWCFDKFNFFSTRRIYSWNCTCY